MRASRILLLLIATLGAAGLVWWSLEDPTPPGPKPILEGDDVPQPGGAADLLQANGATGDPAPEGRQGGPGGDGARANRAQAPLTGLVQDETGRPLAEASVVLREIDPQSLRGAPFPDLRTLAETTTDRDGAFSLEAPTSAWLRVVASHATRATVGRRVASAGAHVVITLPPAGSLFVAAFDHEGKRTSAADLTVRAGEDVFEGSLASGGVAEFRDLPPGDVTVRAIGWAGSTTAGPFAIRSGERTDAAIVLPRGIEIEGRVLDDVTGKPVAGAEVHVSHPGRSEAAETDAQGRFGPLPGGGEAERVFVAVRAEGYVPVLEPVVLRAEKTQSVELRLVSGEPWTGLVQFENGKPAAGASVGYTPDGVAGREPASTVSDENGRFSLPPPPPPAPGRRVVLTARLGDALGALALRPTTRRPASILLTLARGAAVRGSVTDAEGGPLAGVTVRLSPDWQHVERGPDIDAASSRLLATNEMGFVGLATATGTDGRWRLTGVPLGIYRVTFAYDGQTQSRAETLEVRASDVDAGRERFGAGLTLEGRVRDDGGDPVAGAEVRVRPEGSTRGTRKLETTHDGTFVFRGLSAGRHQVTATWGGRDPLRGVVDLVEGEDALIALDFEAAATLRATVRVGDKPYSGVLHVHLLKEGGGVRKRTAGYPSSGRVEIGGLPTGSFTVEWIGARGLRARSALELAPGRTTDVTVELQGSARLRGSVSTPTGEPVAMARVTLVHGESAGSLRVLATADARGAYDVPGLLPGPWSVSAQGRGGGVVGDEVTLSPGETRELDLQLAAAGALAVEVVDARGRSVADAIVYWASETGTGRALLPGRTDVKGRVTLEDVPADEDITVRVRSRDGRRGAATARVEANGTTKVVVRVAEP